MASPHGELQKLESCLPPVPKPFQSWQSRQLTPKTFRREAYWGFYPGSPDKRRPATQKNLYKALRRITAWLDKEAQLFYR